MVFVFYFTNRDRTSCIRGKCCGINIEQSHTPRPGAAARMHNWWQRTILTQMHEVTFRRKNPTVLWEMTDALVTTPTLTLYRASDISGPRWYSHLVRLVRQWQLLSVITCVTTLFLFLSIKILHSAKLLSVHSIQKLYQWQNQMNLLWNVSSELSVSVTPSFSSIHQ